MKNGNIHKEEKKMIRHDLLEVNPKENINEIIKEDTETLQTNNIELMGENE